MHRFVGGQAARGDGREVWIYDLKEDTHRLDLILEPDQKACPFPCRATSPTRRRCERPWRTSGRPTSSTWPGCRPHLPGQPILGARVNVIGTLAVFEAALALEGQGAAGRLRQLGGGSRTGRAVAADASATRSDWRR